MLTDPHREHDDDDPLDRSALRWAPGVSFTAADDDYLTVMLLACGLARIRDDRRRLDAGEYLRRTTADHGLLPVPWRSGAVRLWWRFFRASAAPAVSDLELIELCRKPFAAWPVRLRLSVADQDMTLLDGDDLSPFAEQAARLTVRDVEAELVENQIFAALMMAAEMNGKTEDEVQANYVRLRRLLIDKPVLADQDVHRLAGTFRARSSSGQPYVTRFIEAAYEHRAAQDVAVVEICGGCGNPVVGAREWCGTDGCRGIPTTLELAVVGGYLVQHRAARRFFHDPGLVEARVYDAIEAQAPAGSVRVEAWPGLDAYDLRVSFRDPAAPPDARPVTVWGADAKDQASPGLLGIGFRWKPDPPCDKRFLVLPMHRAERPGYITDLTTELQGRVSGITVIDEQRFIARILGKARQVSGG